MFTYTKHIHNTQNIYTQFVRIFKHIHTQYICLYNVYRAHINEVFELYKRAEDLEPNNAEALIAHAQLLSMIG